MALNEAYNVAGDLWIGPDSAKSNVSPDSGRVYRAVDTQVEYYGDGSSWVMMDIGSAQKQPDAELNNLGVGSVNAEELFPREPHDRSTIPVYYDGVSGDGSANSPWSHSDGTAAVQKAIDALESGRQGKIELPSGEYEITATPYITEGSLRLAGDISGYNEGAPPTTEADVGTKFDLASTVDGLKIDGSGAPQTRNRNSHIEHIYFYGTDDQNGITVPQGAAIEQVTFESLHAMTCEYGFYADGQCDGSRFKGCSFQDNKDGVRFDPNATTQFVRFLDCDLSENSRFPVAIDQSASEGAVIFDDCNFIGNGDALFIGNNENIISDSIIERSGAEGIKLLGDGNLVQNCQFRDNTNGAIEVQGLRNRVANCNFSGNGGKVWITSSATETVLIGVGYNEITDNGTRTVANGVSVNSGNPATTGQWNTNANTALTLGVNTVWDTSVDPPAAYEPHLDAGSGVGWRSKNYNAA